MMRRLAIVLAFAAVAGAACAADANAPAAPALAPTIAPPTAPTIAPSPLASLFARPVVLRGTLGDMQVQLNVRPKEVADEGLEGNYIVFGRSNNILLAGETEDNTLSFEESENGTDISGQWDGSLQGDVLSGTWTSADGQITKPFSLRALRDDTKTATARKTPNRSTK
jgi:hypothetical protein